MNGSLISKTLTRDLFLCNSLFVQNFICNFSKLNITKQEREEYKMAVVLNVIQFAIGVVAYVYSTTR